MSESNTQAKPLPGFAIGDLRTSEPAPPKPGAATSELYVCLAVMAAITEAPADLAWPLAVVGASYAVARGIAKRAGGAA